VLVLVNLLELTGSIVRLEALVIPAVLMEQTVAVLAAVTVWQVLDMAQADMALVTVA